MRHLTTAMLTGMLCLRRATTAFVHPQQRAARRLLASLTTQDEHFLQVAVEHARHAVGHTFPNPCVGCVIVDSDQKILGAGFHPQAGMPHAEVFALLQAAGHLEDGVEAAKTVVQQGNPELFKRVQELTDLYLADPSKLLEDSLPAGSTAYVTLEPCCHHGRTPPCAASLVLAKVDRVVVGFRDPNPRVDGGGYAVLQEAGIEVVQAEGASQSACQELTANFVKRITPRDLNYDETMNGAKRRALRALCGRQKAENTLTEVSWGGPSVGKDVDNLEEAVAQLPLKSSWMEATDELLWQHELVLLRLNKAVAKKKGAKILGERIAQQLDAHVAQVMGHTALLYRPSIPPVIDLDALRRSHGTEDDDSTD